MCIIYLKIEIVNINNHLWIATAEPLSFIDVDDK